MSGGACLGCGTKLAKVGAPIWDTYCPNETCDYQLQQSRLNIRRIMEQREREEYERLKAKFEPASGTPTQRAETTGSVGEADGGPTVATSDGDAQPQSGVNRHG